MAAIELMKLVVSHTTNIGTRIEAGKNPKLYLFKLYRDCRDVVAGEDPEAVANREPTTPGAGTTSTPR